MSEARIAEQAPYAADDSTEWWSPGQPFDCVEIGFNVYRNYVEYDCRGIPDQLIACGAVEPDMVRPGTPGRRRVDSAGDYFYRRSAMKHGAKAGWLRIRRRVTSLARARTLPGMPPDVDHPVIAWLRSRPGAIWRGPRWDVDPAGYRDHPVYCGTSDALIAAGLAAAGDFTGKIDCCGYIRYSPRICVLRLMDGYCEVSAWDRDICEQPERLRRSHLRLVWVNPRSTTGATPLTGA